MQESKVPQDFKQKYLRGFAQSLHDSCKPLGLAAKIALELQTDNIKPGQGELRKNLLYFFVWTPTALNKGQWENYSIAEIEHAARYSKSPQNLIDTIDQAIYITERAIKRIEKSPPSETIPFHWRIIMVLLKQDELSFIESNILKQSISIVLSDKDAQFVLPNINDFLSFDTSLAKEQLDEQFLKELMHEKWDKKVGFFKKEPPQNIQIMRGLEALDEKKEHLIKIGTKTTRGEATTNFYQKWQTLFHLGTGALIKQNPKTQKNSPQVYQTSKEVIEDLIACYVREVSKENSIDPQVLYTFLGEAIEILQKNLLEALEKLTPGNQKLLANHPEFCDYENPQVFLKELISFFNTVKKDIDQLNPANDNFIKALNKTISTLTNVSTAYQNACKRFETLAQNCNDSNMQTETSSIELQEFGSKIKK
jgi:hypothetical protein